MKLFNILYGILSAVQEERGPRSKNKISSIETNSFTKIEAQKIDCFKSNINSSIVSTEIRECSLTTPRHNDLHPAPDYQSSLLLNSSVFPRIITNGNF